MDWRLATRWTLIIGGSFAAGLLAIWVFTGVWARVGLGAAIFVLVLSLLLVNRFSKKQAARKRAGWERSA